MRRLILKVLDGTELGVDSSRARQYRHVGRKVYFSLVVVRDNNGEVERHVWISISHDRESNPENCIFNPKSKCLSLIR